MSQNFDEIVRNAFIETYFQPVADVSDGNIIGYEALTRGPKKNVFFMPNALIAEAKRRGRMDELDLLMRKMALINAEKRGLRKLLFINIEPLSIYKNNKFSEDVVRHCSEYGISPRHIAVEISERSAVCLFDKFQKTISEYRSEGFSIAFDDINFSTFDVSKISSISPDYIKVGGALVGEIETSPEKRGQLESIISISNFIHSKVIAVGVETAEQLKILRSMGVDAVQGNFIGEPHEQFGGVSDKAMDLFAQKS